MKKPMLVGTIVCVGIALLGCCRALDKGHRFISKEAREALAETSRLVKAAQETEARSYAEALTLYEKAVAELEKIISDYPCSEPAVKIQNGEAKVGPYTVAELEEAILPLAKLKAEAEESPLACAFFVAQRIEYPRNKVTVLVKIADKHVELRQRHQAAVVLATAESAAASVEDAYLTSTAFADIAEVYAKSGEQRKAVAALLQAAEAAEGITYGNHEVWVLAQIADVYAILGQQRRAAKWLSRTLSAAKTIKDPKRKASALAWLGRHLAQGGDDLKARRTFQLAFEAARKIKDDGDRDFSLWEITGEQSKVHQFQEAIRTSAAIKKPFWKSAALADISEELAKNGKFAEAVRIAEMVPSGDMKAGQLSEVALKLQASGQEPQALSLLSKALRVARGIADQNIRMQTLPFIAIAYAKAGLKQRAAQITSDIIRDLSKPNEDIPDGVLIWAAGTYAMAGKHELAMQLSRKTNDARLRSSIFSNIAEKSAERGYCDQALRVATMAKDGESKDISLERMATHCANAGKWEHGLRAAEMIAESNWKDIALSHVAQRSAAAEEYEVALRATKLMEDAYFIARALADIGAAHAKSGKELGEEEKKILRAII